jgi:DNA-binding NarL/FixJ family response regulator
MVVDDHALLREGLAAQLRNETDLRLVGEADNAASAIDVAASCKPDVLLMDIDLPGLNTFTAARTIQAMNPNVRIVFLSAYHHDGYIRQALEVKAWGYLTKAEPFTVVCAAIREVASGWVSFSAQIRERIVNTPNGPALAEPAATRASLLSERELELLGYLAKGLSSKEIADLMHISPKTVESHKASLMAKLGIHDRVDLARYAFREGLASP